MNRGFYASTAGLNSQMARMEAVSNNMANIATEGYKREHAVLSPFHEMMLQNMNPAAGRAAGEIGTTNQGSMVEDIVIDFSNGVIKDTGRDTDLALAGDGFFRLEDEDGNHYYTRSGRFNIDSEGYVRHSSGHRLTGEAGPLQVSGSNIAVSKEGIVESGGEEAGRIYVANIEDNSALQKNDNTLFSLMDGGEEVQLETPEIRQGFKEESNATPAREMTTAMEVLRAYGAGQKLVSAHDELNDTAIRKVGGS